MRHAALQRPALVALALLVPFAFACETDVDEPPESRTESQLTEDEREGAMPEMDSEEERTARRETEEAPTLTTAEDADLGTYLADSEGRPIYMFTGDQEGEVTCYDRCARAWPPVLTVEGETASVEGSAVQEGLLGTVERRDGSIQVTYNGHPLYTYVQDEGAREPTGQDTQSFDGEWYLMSPSGEHVEVTGTETEDGGEGDPEIGGDL